MTVAVTAKSLAMTTAATEKSPSNDMVFGNGGDNSGPGSSHSGSGPSGHDDNGTGANCTSSDLIVGATVEEAELELEHGSATFDEVELAHTS